VELYFQNYDEFGSVFDYRKKVEVDCGGGLIGKPGGGPTQFKGSRGRSGGA
jgi:hypothetical protein